MSEYQCYEFLAIDRPLAPDEMAALRKLASRAEISPTRFWTEYNFGDFRGDAEQLVARHFDAHNYFASWGARRLMLRVPARCVDPEPLAAYFTCDAARLTRSGDYVILDLQSDLEEAEYEIDEVSLDLLAPLRAEWMRGDCRLAYLAWLLGVQSGDVDDETREPPVPPGLRDLPSSITAMITFLRIDEDLVAAAAEASAPITLDTTALAAWIRALPARTKDEWLLRAIEEPSIALGGQLERAFRATRKDDDARTARTASSLRTRAEELAQARLRAEAVRRKRAKDAAQRAKSAGYSALAKRADTAWKDLEALIEKSEYIEALRIVSELNDLAIHQGTTEAFDTRLDVLKGRHFATRRGFFIRWGRQQRLREKG